jgi:hypothetical protein
MAQSSKTSFWKNNAIFLVLFLFSLTEIALLLTVCHPCPNGMKCRLTCTLCLVDFIGTAWESFFAMLVPRIFRDNATNVFALRLKAPIFISIFSVLSIMATKMIGGCKRLSMPCQARSFPSIYGAAILLILFSVIALFTVLFENRKEKDL